MNFLKQFPLYIDQVIYITNLVYDVYIDTTLLTANEAAAAALKLATDEVNHICGIYALYIDVICIDVLYIISAKYMFLPLNTRTLIRRHIIIAPSFQKTTLTDMVNKKKSEAEMTSLVLSIFSSPECLNRSFTQVCLHLE